MIARLRLYCLVLAAPSVVLLLLVLLRADVSPAVIAGWLVFAALVLMLITSLLLDQVTRPLQTLANVVAALREDDYSFRARNATSGDAFSELALEINALADTLQGQRLSALEATALLRRVIASLDAPVLAFDGTGTLRLINHAAERLFDLDAVRDIGLLALELNLADLLAQPDEGIVSLNLQGQTSRWMVRSRVFRQRGAPHTLLLLSDVGSALREEERSAWQRLIRVLGHEISNSLAPIKSIAGSLRSRVPGLGNAEGISADFNQGLGIIEGRAEALNRFVQAYRQVAQLPVPVLRRVPLRPLLERAAGLETRLNVTLHPVPEVEVDVDPDQIEQLIINLVRNGVEAAVAAAEDASQHGLPHVDPEVSLRVEASPRLTTIFVEDNGLGLTNPSNLFVPFYTTKKNGSGVGLVLARQIAESHGGTVLLGNRDDARGCRAQVSLPAVAAISSPDPD